MMPGADGTAPARWLAVGTGTAEALRRHRDRQGEASGFESADILDVQDVHDALSALHEGPVTVCVVSAGVIDARPSAALRVLREQLGPAPLLLLDGDEASDARDVARAMGVPLWSGGARPGSSQPPPPAPPSPSPTPADTPTRKVRASRAKAPPPTSTVRVPGTNEVPPLPRADGDVPAFEAADTGAFAGGCLERGQRLGALLDYVVESLGGVSHATRISVMLSEPQGRTLRLRAGIGIHEGLLGTVRCSLGSGIAGRVAALGRIAAGHGSTGGVRSYGGSAYVVLPLGKGAHCEGVVNLTGLPGDALPSSAILNSWATLGRHAGLAIAGARTLERALSASTTDELTGLPNRRAFEGALKREFERARRAGSGLSVCVCDIDHFKSFNDRYGHLVGDVVLREVARRLESAFRETDLVARWGGEEFAILLPDPAPAGAGDAHAVLDRARLGIGTRPFVLGEGLAPAKVTISGGFASFPEVDRSPEALVQAADDALFEAKAQGRDRIVSH